MSIDRNDVATVEVPGWPTEFRDQERVTFKQLVEQTTAEWWVSRFTREVTKFPRHLAEDLSVGIEGPTFTEYSAIDGMRQVVSVELSSLDNVGITVCFQGHSIDFTADQFHHDYIWVHDDFQGDGTGKSIMRNCFRTAEWLGIATMALQAQNVGPYAWARHGFVPDVDSWWQSIVPVATLRLQELKVKGYVEPWAYNILRKALSHYDPKALWSIASFPAKVWVEAEDEYIKIGKVLLASTGVRWYGEMPVDRTTAEAARFIDYVGGL